MFLTRNNLLKKKKFFSSASMYKCERLEKEKKTLILEITYFAFIRSVYGIYLSVLNMMNIFFFFFATILLNNSIHISYPSACMLLGYLIRSYQVMCNVWLFIKNLISAVNCWTLIVMNLMRDKFFLGRFAPLLPPNKERY